MTRLLVTLVTALALAACSAPRQTHPTTQTPATQAPATATPSPTPTPPPWLGTRILPTTEDGYGEVRATPPALRRRAFTLPDTLEPLPGRGFRSRIESPAPPDVIARSTWQSNCPVDRTRLAWVRVTFWGFDEQRHTGELLVHERVAEDVVEVFRRLHRERFPIEEMRITRMDERDAPPTGDGNNTESFVCREVRGSERFSEHASGLAIDVNPFQNPYVKGDWVLPELASSYLDRARERPGMIVASGEVVAAFASIGWEWGGDWNSLKDYQHFSWNGR